MEDTQSAWTGLVGLVALSAGAILLACHRPAADPAGLSNDRIARFILSIRQTPLLPESIRSATTDYLACTLWGWRYAILTGFVLLSMVAVELFVVKAHRRHFDYSAPHPMDSEAWRRVRNRCLGAFCCLVPITFLYVYLGEYSFFAYPYPSHWYYAHYRTLFVIVVPAILILSWPYFWMVERYGRLDEPLDEFLIVSHWIRRSIKEIRSGDPLQKDENAHIANLARALLVKFFFIPVMVSFCFGNWNAWEFRIHGLLGNTAKMNWDNTTDIALNIHVFALSVYAFILLTDVTLGLVGYLASLRVLDTQVTTAEPTLFGWMVALLCYPPIQRGVTAIYLEYSGYDIWPERIFRQYPTAAILATFCSLLLMGIYAWATVAFGLRFSNLTNRGVVCKGPYAVVRHPAYICKNAAWWVEALPSLFWVHLSDLSTPLSFNPSMAPIMIMRLVGSNVLYGLRAMTEERHLMREAHYREYCKKVPWRFIPGLW